MAVLDQRVVLERRDPPAEARRPARAPEARAGRADEPADDDEQHGGGRRRDRELLEPGQGAHRWDSGKRSSGPTAPVREAVPGSRILRPWSTSRAPSPPSRPCGPCAAGSTRRSSASSTIAGPSWRRWTRRPPPWSRSSAASPRPAASGSGRRSASGRTGPPGGPTANRSSGPAPRSSCCTLSALVHDDVMDRSDERRGADATHVRFAEEAPPGADPDAFGTSAAILVGDLAARALGAAPAHVRVRGPSARAGDVAVRPDADRDGGRPVPRRPRVARTPLAWPR